MRRILEKFPSDFNKRDDQDQQNGVSDPQRGSENPDQEQERDKPPADKPHSKKPGSGGDDSPITLRDLKKLVAMKSVDHEGEEPKEDDEDEDGAEKTVTDTGKDPNVVKKEPVIR